MTILIERWIVKHFELIAVNSNHKLIGFSANGFSNQNRNMKLNKKERYNENTHTHKKNNKH